jgi:hypothetical protein
MALAAERSALTDRNNGSASPPNVRRARPSARRRLAGTRRDSLLSPLAGATNVRADTEYDVAAGEAREFVDPQAGLGGDEEQRVVAPAGPPGAVQCGQQRIELVCGEEGNQGSVERFGDGEHTLDKPGVVGMAQRREAKL